MKARQLTSADSIKSNYLPEQQFLLALSGGYANQPMPTKEPGVVLVPWGAGSQCL